MLGLNLFVVKWINLGMIWSPNNVLVLFLLCCYFFIFHGVCCIKATLTQQIKLGKLCAWFLVYVMFLFWHNVQWKAKRPIEISVLELVWDIRVNGFLSKHTLHFTIMLPCYYCHIHDECCSGHVSKHMMRKLLVVLKKMTVPEYLELMLLKMQ